MSSSLFCIATRQLSSDVRKSLDLAASLGVGGVQLEMRQEVPFTTLTESAVRHLRHLITERELKLASGILPTRYSLSEPEKIDERVSAIKNSLQATSLLGGSQLIVRLGKIPQEATSRPYEKLVDIMTDLAAYGNHRGVALCLSIHWEELKPTLAFLETIKTGLLTIDLDPYQILTSRVSMDDALMTSSSWLSHATFQDGIQETQGRFQPAMIGRGEIEWVPLVVSLTSLPQTIWKTVLSSSPAGQASVNEIQQSLGYLRSLLPLM